MPNCLGIFVFGRITSSALSPSNDARVVMQVAPALSAYVRLSSFAFTGFPSIKTPDYPLCIIRWCVLLRCFPSHAPNSTHQRLVSGINSRIRSITPSSPFWEKTFFAYERSGLFCFVIGNNYNVWQVTISVGTFILLSGKPNSIKAQPRRSQKEDVLSLYIG